MNSNGSKYGIANAGNNQPPLKNEPAENVISVSSARQLFAVAEKINKGDREASGANYRLECDIDMKGKKWKPIGTPKNPFSGAFTGAGYRITDFKAKDKKAAYSGFFGALQDAEIINLHIVPAKKKRMLLFIILGAVLAGLLAGGYFYINREQPPEPPLLIDPGQKEDPNDKRKPREDANQLSYNFSKSVAFNGTDGSFLLKNSGYSNQIIVVEIQIADAELIGTIGKTGRTPKQINEIEKAAGYDPEKSRMAIAKTGGVEPGYYLTSFEMQKLPDGTYLPKGTYKGLAVLKVYDMNTHVASVVDTELNITIFVN